MTPTTFQATAFKVEPDLTGAAILQGTTSAGTAGSQGYYSLKCGTDLTTSTAPTDSTEPVAPEIENNTLQYTVWTQNDLPTQSAQDATFFSDATKSGQQMRVQSISCVDSSAQENSGYAYVVTAAPFNATSQQDNVIIRANAEEVRKHLALLYLNSANTIAVPIAINTPTNVSTTVTGVSYNAETKKALFGKKTGSDSYVTQLTVTVPRNYQISVENSAGQVVSTLAQDNSYSTGSGSATVQTLNVTATQDDRANGLTVKVTKVQGATLYMPSYHAPSDRYPNYGRVRRLSVMDASGTWTDYKHVCEQAWRAADSDGGPDDTRLWNYQPEYLDASGQVVSTSGYGINRGDNCASVDYWYHNSHDWKTMNVPIRSGFQMSTNTSLVKASDQTEPTISGTKLPETAPYGGSVSWLIDTLPQRPMADDNIIVGKDVPNAFIAGIKINGQDVFVPFPQMCVNPANPDDNTGFQWCGKTTNGWSISEVKGQYSCVRGWALGLTTRTDPSTWCGMTSGAGFTVTRNVSAANNDNRRVLVDETFETGPNAGMRVRVWLINVRPGADRTSLRNRNMAGNTNGDVSNPENWVLENRGNRDDARAANIWRARYEVQVDNIQTPSLTVEADAEWNTSSHIFLTNAPGTLASSKATRTSVQVWGHLNGSDETMGGTNRWITLCDGVNSSGQASGDTSLFCQYSWQNLTGTDGQGRMQFRTVVPNGYGPPKIEVLDSRATISGGTYNATDDYYYFYASKISSRVYNGASGNEFTRYANTNYPLTTSATALDFPVKYMAVDGTTQLSGSDNWPAVFNVNAATRYSFDVANRVPDTGNLAFNSWRLEGWNGGQKVGTVLTGIEPGANVDIRNLTFLDGEKSGKRALTDGGGNAQINELRLVPDTSTTATGKRAGIYPVTRTIEGGAADGNNVNDTVWYYRAVPGMHTELATSYRESDAVKEISYTPGNPTPARDFTLNKDESEFGVINLAETVNNPALLLYYGLKGTTVKFTKTIQNDTGFTWQVPVPANFALRLTSIADASKYYTIKHGQTSSTALPAGTYTLSEVQGNNSSDAILQTWKPAVSATLTSGFSCKFDGEENEKVSQQNKQVILEASSKALNCAVTNTSAAIGLVTYDEDKAAYIDAPSTGAEYSYSFVPVNSSDNALTSSGWEEKSLPSTSSGFLTPGVAYQLNVTKKPIGTYTKIQKFTGTKDEFDSKKDDAESWEDASLDNFSLTPNEYNIYRVVIQRYHPVLPLTGGPNL